MDLNCGSKNTASELDAQFWNNRGEQRQTGWDVGYPSPPIEEYLLQLDRKDLKILIPGFLNAYEAQFS